MTYLAGIFALVTGAAGWFYLFYSRAAQRLSGIEDQRLNDRRIALRRFGGVAMLLLAGCFFAGFRAIDDPPWRPGAILTVWAAVLVLLIVIMILGLVDLRLTYRIRRRNSGAKGLSGEQQQTRHPEV